MDNFCNKCGILLQKNTSWTVPTQFCNPCLEALNPANFETCECELCGPRLRTNESAAFTSDNHTLVVQEDSMTLALNLSSDEKLSQNSPRQRSKKRNKRNQNQPNPQPKAVKQQESSFLRSGHHPSHNHKRHFDLDSETEFPVLGSKHQTSTVLIDWTSQGFAKDPAATVDFLGELLEDWGNLDPTSPVAEDNLWDNMGLASSTASKPKVSKNVSEDLKQSPDKENNKNYHLVEEIRVKWEREQKEYRSKMSTADTSDIAALVAGRRRKQDGSRYFVGGVDISFIKGNSEDACACLSVLRMPDLKLVYQRMEMVKLTQPYIPGFLAFREVPCLEPLFSHLKTVAPQFWPDITLVDGNGKLHPRGFGLACHLGVVLDIPTMGVAKSLISAQGISEDEEHKNRKRTLAGAGDDFDLISDSGEVLGKCLRVHDGAPNPVYISVGHKVSLESAKWLALECSMYRIPEPVRRADLDSREYLRQGKTDPEEFIFSGEEEEVGPTQPEEGSSY